MNEQQAELEDEITEICEEIGKNWSTFSLGSFEQDHWRGEDHIHNMEAKHIDIHLQRYRRHRELWKLSGHQADVSQHEAI